MTEPERFRIQTDRALRRSSSSLSSVLWIVRWFKYHGSLHRGACSDPFRTSRGLLNGPGSEWTALITEKSLRVACRELSSYVAIHELWSLFDGPVTRPASRIPMIAYPTPCLLSYLEQSGHR